MARLISATIESVQKIATQSGAGISEEQAKYVLDRLKTGDTDAHVIYLISEAEGYQKPKGIKRAQ